MEKRLLLAVVLMTAAIMFTNLFFRPAVPPPSGDSSAAVDAPTSAATNTPGAALPLPVATPGEVRADSIVVASDLYRYVLSTRGGTVLRAELLDYSSYSDEGGPVQLVPEGVTDFLAHQLVIGSDTIDLRALPFQASTTGLRLDEGSGAQSVDLSYADGSGFAVALRYEFTPDGYPINISGRVEGVGGRESRLLTTLGPGLEPHEHPDHHSEQQFAVVTGIAGDVDRLAFGKVEGREALQSPFNWVGIKDKYFLAAVVAGAETPFSGAVVADAPDATRVVADEDELVLPRARVTSILPLSTDGSFSLLAYLGPQDYGRLSAVGYDLQDATPYGYRWLQPVIRPLAAAVVWVLDTLHVTLGIAYGWVLVIFGVLMRIVLWPLNAKAMRAQMKNMGVQPLLQEIKDKYKNDPQKQQEAMLSLYKEHGFNPLAGCLPMLVPFPVLITLFFVFQNTIAFRGAEFLWLPDLSLPDPFYLLPLVLVVSMFGLQWLSAHLSGMEQNPQMKMMMYMMPVMMGALFFMLPAGLNLYYAVNQVASIPQQVLIAKERKRAQDALKKEGGLKLTPPLGSSKVGASAGGSRRKKK